MALFENFSGDSLVSLAKTKEGQAYNKSLAGDFSNIVGSFIDYNALKMDLKNYGLQAQNVELAAKQQANQIRQQYLQTAANYSYNAARRGISVNSASVRSNLEGSAEAMGRDIQRLDQNASVKASALRNQAKVLKAYGRAEMVRNVTGSIMNMAETGAKMVALGGA